MPVHQRFLEPFGLNHVRATEPFALLDLVENMQEEIENNAPKEWLSAPVLLDLSEIRLLRFEAEEFRRLIRFRMSFASEQPGGPAALLAGDEGSFGMLRMFTIYSELQGFRKENMAFVTTDIREAVAWLYPKLGEVQGNFSALLEEVMQPVPLTND